METSENKVKRREKLTLQHSGWAHGNARLLDLRAGDTVVVLAGKDRGKRGTIERTLAAQQRVVVSGVNMLKRHTKSGAQGNVQGGIVDFSAPIAYSNVMLICNRCDKPTRVQKRQDEHGQWHTVCQKCGEIYERVKS